MHDNMRGASQPTLRKFTNEKDAWFFHGVATAWTDSVQEPRKVRDGWVVQWDAAEWVPGVRGARNRARNGANPVRRWIKSPTAYRAYTAALMAAQQGRFATPYEAMDYWLAGSRPADREYYEGQFRVHSEETAAWGDGWNDGVRHKGVNPASRFSHITYELVKGWPAAKINATLDSLDKADSILTDDLIAAGFGHTRPSDMWAMARGRMEIPPGMGALLPRWEELSEARRVLSAEVERRAGPGMRRLPKGFGPLKMNPNRPTTAPIPYYNYYIWQMSDGNWWVSANTRHDWQGGPDLPEQYRGPYDSKREAERGLALARMQALGEGALNA